MANTLAGMVVNLGLNAVEYFQGLTKAEYQAKKFASSFEQGMATVRTAAKAVGVAFIVKEIYDLGKSVISAAADLNDFADQTGSSVEALSKLATQAQIAGTPFEELQQATLKLAVAMGGTDEKSKNVAEIFKTLGVTAKDPATAMQQLAVALSKYQDGATKAAYANELFGKSGARFLATLKDIANLQDVVGITTAEQARKAEELEQAYRRLGAEATKFKNIILDFVVPALTHMISRFVDSRNASDNLFEGLKLWAQFNPFGNATENLESLNKEIAELEATVANPTFMGFKFPVSDQILTKIENLKKAREIAIKEQERNVGGFPSNAPIGKVLPTRPEKGRTQAERTSDAQRYLESLEKQLLRTQDLTVEETLLAEIQSGRLKLSGDVTEQQLRNIAQQIDAAHAFVEEEKERQRITEEMQKLDEKISQDKVHQIEQYEAEAQAIAKENEQLKLHIEEIGLDAISLAALNHERINAAINTKEQTLALMKLRPEMELEAKAMQDQIDALRERKGLLVRQGIAEQIAADTAKATEINNLFVDSFAEGAASIAKNAKSIGDAVKMMSARIVDAFTQIAAKNIGTALFGAATSSGGGGIFSDLGPFIAKMFGAGMAGGGGGAGWVSGFDLPGFATGTPFAPGGMAIVGERGPELVNIPRGAQVTPMSGKGGMSVHQTINVLPGASTRSATQAAMQAGLAAQRALEKNA